MRKVLILSFVIAAIFSAKAALADTYDFPAINARITLDDAYETVVTPATISGSESFIATQGGAPEAWQTQFEQEGILLKAWDAESGRVLIITALADVDGTRLFDINLHTSDVRKAYRLSHSQNIAYKALGYTYSSAEWKNYGDNLGRFLMLKYSLREDGKIAYRGFQRRTIRNGYTITLDVQVAGRQVTGADNTAMNKANEGFFFTEILPMPPLPVTFTVTDAPPDETSEASFAMKGTSAPGATISATLVAISSNQANLFDTTAKSSGAYTLNITLPTEGVYYMTVTATAPGAIERVEQYTVTYQKGVLPFNLDTSIPEQLTSNTFVVSGTTDAGVSVQLVVNGNSTTKKTGTSGAFSFTVDTDTEGEYTFDIMLQKKNFDARTEHYSATRTFTEEDRRAKIRDEAVKPSYANLVSKINGYDGRIMGYNVYLTAVNETGGQYIMTMAMSKSRDIYKDFLTVTSNDAPGIQIGDRVKMYGRVAGMYYTLVEGGKDVTTPLLELLFIEPIE